MTAINYGSGKHVELLILSIDGSGAGPVREARTRGAQLISCGTVTGTGREKKEEKNERRRM
jgi:hypothetical protein